MSESQVVYTKIVGGSTAEVGAWPWQVALLVDGVLPEFGQFCAGSLITNQWVVTAAHCMFDPFGALKQPSDIDVQVGIHTLSTNAGQRRDLTSIVVHPNYNFTTLDNDIALVKLSSPVTFSSTVSTIVPLTSKDATLANPGVTATVTGWGRTNSGGSLSDVLLQVGVPIVSTSDCNSGASYNGLITGNMMCAGAIEDGDIDSCQGDSGGPLVVPEGTGWRLAGVVSWGFGCALQRFPGVYTRVTEMRDFINQNTGVFVADVSLIKSVSPLTGQPEGELTYTITVSNVGLETATAVTVTDVLPAGLTLVSAATTQGACFGAQTVTCVIGNLAASSSAALTVKVNVDSGFSGTVINTATATTTAVESSTLNNSASVSAVIVPNADLSISKTASATSVPAGGFLTYGLTVTNNGPSTSTQSMITDALPIGLTLIASSTAGASCVGESVVTCSFGAIAVGAKASVTLTTTVAIADLGTIVNTAAIGTSTPHDLNSTNNQATATVVILPPPADLKITKTAPVGPVLAGSGIVYSIQVINNGPATSTNITVADELPTGVTLVGAIPTQGSCSGISIIICNLGQLTVGKSAEISVRVTIATSTRGQLVNIAVASSTVPDDVLANNSAVAVTQIPSVGVWGMAAMASLLGSSILWRNKSRRKPTI